MNETILIGAREYKVTTQTDARGQTIYLLQGKRGATYATMRCVRGTQFTDVFFIVHAGRGFGIPAGFDRVRLTDRNGALEVLSC